MVRRWSRRALGLFTLLASVGCGATPVNLAEGPRAYVATDYEAVRSRWTREESLILFEDLERALTVTATFETWDFRWAYVVRYARDYRLTVAQRQRLMRRQLEDTRKEHEFFVSLYGAELRLNDLTRDDAAWVVRLVDDQGHETAPSQIQRIRSPNAIHRRYYPDTNPWRQSFRIRFPVASSEGQPSVDPGANWLGLRFAGAWGNVDLVWDLAQPDATASDDPTVAMARAKPQRTVDGRAAPRRRAGSGTVP
ncbi:MAG: hypothetical protein AAF928_08190 [Myxococcota bacterium]